MFNDLTKKTFAASYKISYAVTSGKYRKTQYPKVHASETHSCIV